MKQYIDMCKYILENGQQRKDRTGTGTISVFGTRQDIILRKDFLYSQPKKCFSRA